MAFKAAIQLPPELTHRDIPKNLLNNQKFIVEGKKYICIRMEGNGLFCCNAENKVETKTPTEIDAFYWIREA